MSKYSGKINCFIFKNHLQPSAMSKKTVELINRSKLSELGKINKR